MLKTLAQCDIEKMALLQDFLFLHISELFGFITSLIAIPIAGWALQKCYKHTRFHVNFRIIGAVHCVCLLIHCFGRLLQNGSAIYLWLSDVELCEKRMQFGTCLLARLMYIFGLYSSSLTTLFMCIERTMATKFYKKYETKNWQLGVFLVGFQVLLSSMITLGYYLNSTLEDRPPFCFFDIRREWALLCEFLMILANIVGFWQCRRLNRINKDIRTQKNTIALGQKFQVEENKMLIKVMNQFTIMDFIFMICFFSFGGAQFLVRKYMSLPLFFAVYELIHCVPVYAIIVLLLMMRIVGNLRIKKSREIIKVVQIKEDAYFHYFNKEWNK